MSIVLSLAILLLHGLPSCVHFSLWSSAARAVSAPSDGIALVRLISRHLPPEFGELLEIQWYLSAIHVCDGADDSVLPPVDGGGHAESSPDPRAHRPHMHQEHVHQRDDDEYERHHGLSRAALGDVTLGQRRRH